MTLQLIDQLESESRDRTINLLKWISAFHQETPNDTSRVCTYNLSRVLVEVRQVLPMIEHLADDSITEVPTTQTIEQLESEIARLSPNDPIAHKVKPDLTGRRLMQGYIGDYPLYCVLPYHAEDAGLDERYCAYKAALLIISHTLLQFLDKKQAMRDYRSAIGRAADALRLSADSPILEILPDILQCGIAEAHEILEAQRNDDGLPVSRSEKRHIEALETLFRFYLKGTGGSLRTRRRREIDSSPDSSEKQEGKRTRIVRTFDISDQEISSARKTGLAPTEFASDVEYITEDDEADPENVESTSSMPQTLARQAMARQQRLDAIEKNAQLLPNSRNRLAPWEHAIFLRVLKNNSLQNSETRIAIRNEAIAVLAISFWLSKKLGDILQLRIYQDESHLPQQIHTGFVGYLQASREWVLSPLRPKGEPKYADINKNAAVQVAQILKLRDNVDTAFYLSQLSTWQRATHLGSSSAFTSPGAKIEEEANGILQQAKLLSHDRITRARIAETLYLSVFDACGDKALASLVLSRAHRLGDTQLHYTEASSDTLREIYATTCRTLSERALAELTEFDQNPIRPEQLGKHPPPVNQSIGCPIRPAENAIARLVTELIQAINRTRSGIITTDFVIDFHNLYTVYTIQQLQHLTGLRAVNNPIPSLACIDFDNNLLLASDKDDYTSFNTRIVPLTRVVTTQLKYYLIHRRTMLSRMAVFDPKLAKTLNLSPPSATQGETRPNPGPVFFFLSREKGKLKHSATAPSLVQEKVRRFAPWFGLPENCHRSRIRSRLLALNCPPQWVDGLLGHWTRGEEPWHRFASTSLKRMCDGLRIHLETIAQNDGWQPVRGLG